MGVEDLLVVIGASGHAKVVIDVIEKEGRYAILGLIDSYKLVGTSVYGYEILGADEYLPSLVEHRKVAAGIIAIGDNWKRHLMARKIASLVPAFRFVSAVHPSAAVARGVKIGAGTVLMAGAVVNSDCRIGNFCILNTNASLDHDGLMGDFSSLAPGAAAGGNVTIGEFSAVALGACISHGVAIGEHTVLGAGALALEDIPDHCVAYGIPARVVRKRGEGDRYL
jgi:sugar O-acyltransferase (sialic acid O-acetyltransferase NeuD family)